MMMVLMMKRFLLMMMMMMMVVNPSQSTSSPGLLGGQAAGASGQRQPQRSLREGEGNLGLPKVYYLLTIII